MAGLSIDLNATEINRTAGGVAQDLQEAMVKVQQFKEFLDTWDDAALAGFGLSSADIITIRSVFVDLAQIRNLYVGGATLAVAYDHRTFAKRIFGFGFHR